MSKRMVSPLKPANSSLETSTFRPKAKVNASAFDTTRKVTGTVSVNASPKPPSRAPSPTKLTPRVVRKGGLPNKAPSAVGTIARSQTPSVPAPVTPELRARSFTTSSGSPSLHHVASLSSFQPSVKSTMSTTHRLASSKSVVGLSDRDREEASSPAMRIRSKVSTMAKSQSESITRTFTPPLQPSTRSASFHTRSPSSTHTRSPSSTHTRSPSSSHKRSPSLTSSPTSPPPTFQIYPITTAAPAANPHRFAQLRPPSVRIPAAPTFQSLSSPQNDRPSRLDNNNILVAKVDPTFIPLPPLSPPSSSLSFSSKSSLSHSSASHTAGSTTTDSRLSPVIKQSQNGNAEHLRSTLDTLVMYTSVNSGDDGDSGHDRETDGEFGNNEDRKVKAEAKSNRKIADLEITNRSLLAINASLEATKHRQSKEIYELRRKLRESRLMLPPRAFRAVKSSLEPAENGDDEEDIEDDSEAEDLVEGNGDEMYKRIKLIVDTLLQTGRKALETQIKDFPEGGKGGAKVLSAEELRDWHGSIEHDDPFQHVERDEQRPNNLLSEAELSFETSEDEVEAMTLPKSSPQQSPTSPPIFIIESTST